MKLCVRNLVDFTHIFNGIELKLEMNNSWGEEKAEAQHMKAKTQSLKNQRNQINRKGETQEKDHKSKQESVSLMWRGTGTTLIPPGWHPYLSDTLEIIRQDGLEVGQQVSKRSERRLLQLPINIMGLFLDGGNKTKRS